MPRKILAALLVIGCTLLAAFDILEDINFLAHVEFAKSNRASGVLHIGNVVDNDLDSADQLRVNRSSPLEPSDLMLRSGFPPTTARSLKLYKLQRIFLI